MKTPEEQAEEWEARTRSEYCESPDSKMWHEYYLPEEMSPQNAFLAGYSAGLEEGRKSQCVKCSERMPKIGQDIVLWLPNGTWVAGTVDGSDDGLFVDYELDGEPITTRCTWMPLPPPLVEESK